MTTHLTTAPDFEGLRVLAFCDYFSPNAIGGSERVALETYRRLAGWGASVTIVAAVPGGKDPYQRLGGCTVITIPARDLSSLVGAQLALSGRLPTAAARAWSAARPNVLHTHSLHFQGSAVAAALHRIRRTPLVPTIHLGATDNLSPLVRAATETYEGSVGRFILSASDKVIAVSRPVAEHLARRGVEAARIHVVENGVDHLRFRPADTEPADEQILFVGRLIANKGPGTLVEALVELSQRGHRPRVAFCGDGPLLGELRARVHQAGLSGTVSFEGAVTDVADRMRRATILVRPSTSEGLPLAVLEAQAAGVCVVASDIPGNDELISDGDNGVLVPPNSPAALAVALEGLLVDPARRRRLAQRGHATSQRYSWDNCAKRTGEILLEAAGNQRRSRRAAPPISSFDLPTLDKIPTLRRLIGAGGDGVALDIGVGTGYTTARVLSGWTTVGVDLAASNLAYARRQAAAGGPAVLGVVAHAAALPFRSASLSRVLCSEVLEHLDDDDAAVGEIARVLAPAGRLVATVPYSGFTFVGLPEALGIPTVHDVPGPEFHVRRGYDEHTLADLLRRNGLAPGRPEYYLRLFTKAIVDGITIGHLGYQRLVKRRRSWTWAQAAEIETSPIFAAYRAAFPALRWVSSMDRFLHNRRGFGLILEGRKE